jgi:glyoxylase I family protein
MFQIKCIDHIVLRTRNLEKMISFYSVILGCPVENVQKEIALVQLRAGDSIIDLVKIKTEVNKEVEKNVEHFCLRIVPFDYQFLKKYFEEKNVEIYRYGKRYGAQGIGASFYLKDPENNEIELKEGT